FFSENSMKFNRNGATEKSDLFIISVSVFLIRTIEISFEAASYTPENSNILLHSLINISILSFSFLILLIQSKWRNHVNKYRQTREDLLRWLPECTFNGLMELHRKAEGREHSFDSWIQHIIEYPFRL